jgi:hypothetical protein
VLLVMAAGRRGGRRFGGMVAALPLITAPTLAWIVHADGVDLAVEVAIGSTAACAMMALFAFGYAVAARHHRAAVALLCGLGSALLLALPALMASRNAADALVLAVATCALVGLCMPAGGEDVAPRHRSTRAMLPVAAAAAGVVALAASVGPTLGGFTTGVLASLPVITASVAMFEHTACGHRAASHFLRGYVGGLMGKAAFGVVFAWLAPHAGAVAALAAACGCVAAMSAWRTRPLPLAEGATP